MSCITMRFESVFSVCVDVCVASIGDANVDEDRAHWREQQQDAPCLWESVVDIRGIYMFSTLHKVGHGAFQ